MIFEAKINEFIQLLKNSEDLSSCKIINAYPNVKKPTRLDCTLISVSLGEIEGQSVELGGDVLVGSYKINATIFSSIGKNDIANTIKGITDAVLCMYPSAISVSEINADDNIHCIYAKCGFTFFDNISFGGDADEQRCNDR